MFLLRNSIPSRIVYFKCKKSSGTTIKATMRAKSVKKKTFEMAKSRKKT